ncbi:class I SAM-dependent methyltransferase [Thiorhodococcus mannitoliphagus]|uniref:Class I SAM-dependent methyltransferase n=1 Tax=Thiorhodococcus mannitoliphagus TaxID=329406 RepID=A0A6P1DPJ5_9GAMM|nr:class I SAM-dependent methyltransferase [Thiorhodococcus mannitoliphagus]NEX19073.1 class I SAM-dependent methyltransferase [Thiorhodococcus mannitoliphagus]
MLRGRSGRLLREDFCGTGTVCCEWVRRRRTNRAWGLDLDAEVLDWGRTRNLGGLDTATRARVELRQADVLTPQAPQVDIVLAMNFSYWLLRHRSTILSYFRRVRESLRDDGVLFLDAYGGYDAFRVLSEERRVSDPDGGDFTYVWDQAAYDPISGRLQCDIHFRFDDGSSLERAFSYDWRLWTLPEIRELLAEAGFSRTLVYWQGWDEDDEPDGHFVPVETGEPDAGWIAYLSAEK